MAALPLLGSHLLLGIRASKLIFLLVSCYAQLSTHRTKLMENHLISAVFFLSSSKVSPNRISPGAEPIHQISSLFRALSLIFLLGFTFPFWPLEMFQSHFWIVLCCDCGINDSRSRGQIGTAQSSPGRSITLQIALKLYWRKRNRTFRA